MAVASESRQQCPKCLNFPLSISHHDFFVFIICSSLGQKLVVCRSPTFSEYKFNMSQEPSCSTDQSFEKKLLEPSESTEECSICRGDDLIDKTLLDSCIHTFCYKCITEWLKFSNGPICPMCKQTIHILTHELNKKRPTTEDAQQIHESASRQRMNGEAIQENIRNIRRIVQVTCRKYRTRAREYDNNIDSMRRKGRIDDGKIERCEVAKRSLISELNALQLIKDQIMEGSRKEFIIRQTAFRKLIYVERLCLHLPMEHSELTAHHAASIPDLREKFVPFLIEEFRCIPVKYHRGSLALPNKFIHDTLDGKDEEMANRIVNLILKQGVEKAHFVKQLCDLLNARTDDVMDLIAHMRSFAEHPGSFLTFLQNVDYTLRTELQGRPVRQVVVDDVVLDSDSDVDDDDDDDEEVPPVHRNPFLPDLSRRFGSYSINTFPFLNQPRSVDLRSIFRNNQRERDHRSTSESDGDREMYERQPLQHFPPTRPPQPPPLVRPTLKAPFWNDLVGGFNCPPPQNQSINRNKIVVPNNDSVVVLSDDDEPTPSSSSRNRSNNDTIVLDDSIRRDEPASSRNMNSNRRPEKRRLPIEREERNRSMRRRTDDVDLPVGFADAMYNLLSEYDMTRHSDMRKVEKAAEMAFDRIRFDISSTSSGSSTSSESLTSSQSSITD
ncbi:unnamed protein product [Caenorhabditis angaria]|uniref:RING-type domain-containing protein n=1 Tax=Caenorhabditis angaria TaxID=860376 RepID=A0A9P1MW37_9PELO|nr:unnamed protein product [Caenorhabditis angaria]